MIIRNEKDRLKAMRMLEDAEFPCEFWLFEGEAIKITQGYDPKDKTYNFNLVMDATDFYDYPDTPKVNYYCKFCNSPVIRTGYDKRHGVIYSCTDSDCLTSINLYSRDVVSRLEHPDTLEPELGDHPSGMTDNEDHW